MVAMLGARGQRSQVRGKNLAEPRRIRWLPRRAHSLFFTNAGEDPVGAN